MDKQKWVGIFQAEWPLQCHTLNSAIVLAKSGFNIDLFLYDTHIIDDFETLYQSSNINIYIFDEPYNGENYSGTQLLYRLRRKLFKQLNKFIEPYLYHSNNDNFIPYYVNKNVFKIAKSKQYECLIGIEKLGLVWAAKLANKINVPYVYHSLELHSNNHPYCNKSLHIKRLKKAEEKYHKSSYATIIQDEDRADFLFKDNGIKSEEDKIIYLPVSLLGDAFPEKLTFLQEKFKIDKNQLIILQFGQASRFGIELTQISQKFPQEWTLAIHDGLLSNLWGDDTYIKKLQSIDTKKRVIFSTDKLKSKQIKDLVASAHIGLVLYSNSCENDILTVFASEKLALYLQCGLPVIAFDYPGYEIIEQSKCGVLIKTIEDLPNAIKIISNDFDKYRLNAYKTFIKYYQFEPNFEKVIKMIKNLSVSKR
ncbi:hypothetical protein [Calothrix sp. UHCC 0171]|uniref:hypothetical protein n=1 Tax=Calothrix sp. UHCC 0171 TaxID=3110245 RepID=UPI002B20CDB0|nr:hypothetical protein [Calothrix sp. UHCC 0171]MEA5573954.1 hypothetical protein [Calothrix sp. UHCC 0171]